ncbi:MAG: ABC transporter substrate-binding protein [Negativicutes bacterium]|jgi:iron complex transport system substrate-binding protein
MKTVQKLFFAIIIVVLATCAGCGTQPSSVNSVGASLSFPMTVTDALGNEISLSKQPVRIISLALTTDEILAAVADKSAIYGLSTYSDDKFYSNIVDFSATIPHKFTGKDLEKIIQAKPDLLLTSDWVDARDLARLRAVGIPVFTFKLPDTIDDIRKLIQTVGVLTGNNTRATGVITELNRRLKAVSTATETIPADNRLNAIMTDNLFYVFGTNALSAQLFTVANINNLAAKMGVTNVDNVSKERIVAANPQAIFVSAYSAEENSNPLDIYLKDKSFANVTAIKTNRVFVISSPHMTSASQFIALGAEDIARCAYPAAGIK